MCADYVVGRGRPPLATRFQKGNSAARGRRRGGEKSFVALLFEALAEPLTEVGTDGRRTRLAKCRLGLRRFADRVADGDPQAIKLVLGVALALDRRGSGETDERSDWAPANKAVIENLRALLGAP
jgi:Family of unknown function (DUF5681)